MSVKLMSLTYQAHFPDIEITYTVKTREVTTPDIGTDKRVFPTETAHKEKTRKVIAPNIKSVCLAMADTANDEGEGTYQSVETLSEKTELSRVTVIACIKAMQKIGLISYVGRSRWNTSNYTINKSLLVEMTSWPRRKGKAPAGAESKAALLSPDRPESKAPLLSEVKPLYFPGKAPLLNPLDTSVKPLVAGAENTPPHAPEAEQGQTTHAPAIQEKPKRGDALDAHFQNEAYKAEVRARKKSIDRIVEYPADVQDLLTELIRVFHFAEIPHGGKPGRRAPSNYQQWINELRVINGMINGYGLKPIAWAYEDNLKRPREISHPAALNSLILNALRERKALEDKRAADRRAAAEARRRDEEKKYIPAPDYMQELRKAK